MLNAEIDLVDFDMAVWRVYTTGVMFTNKQNILMNNKLESLLETHLKGIWKS